ncbi:uncharacterized protein [Procambarus clarkii]|uniref:uncharacterized protein n=1 Tax=Procambarus clarkii TaxID=6728 RepID=UPI0037434022
MRNLRRILDIKWKDHVTNNTVIERTGVPSLFTLLKQRRMRWLGHVTRMEDGCILKDLLYGELASGRRPTGRPQLRFKYTCKCDRKQLTFDINTWEAAAVDRSAWRWKVQKGLQQFKDDQKRQGEDNRLQRRSRPLSDAPA